MNILMKILCKILKFTEEILMILKPSMCGSNALHLPSVCEDLGHFNGLNDVTLLQGDPFSPTAGVTAVDKDGNEIPYTVSPSDIETCNVGDYVLTYSTENFSKERRVYVIQSSAPAISGMATAIIGVGDSLNTMTGVSAIDVRGNAVSVACTEGNLVSYNTAGIRTLHYTATDACGNVGTATRTVDVRLGHFEGVTPASVNQGIGFDLRDGVTAKKYDGTVVPFNVTPAFAPCQLGEQTFTYTADGVETATRTITVNAIADPTISGISEPIEVKPSEEFDPLDGVTAVDGNGNTITVTVVLEP